MSVAPPRHNVFQNYIYNKNAFQSKADYPVPQVNNFEQSPGGRAGGIPMWVGDGSTQMNKFDQVHNGHLGSPVDRC